MNQCVNVHVCVGVCACAFVYVSVYMCTCSIYFCTHVDMYMCVYMCVYMCICVFLFLFPSSHVTRSVRAKNHQTTELATLLSATTRCRDPPLLLAESSGLTDARALRNGPKPRPLVHDVLYVAALL